MTDIKIAVQQAVYAALNVAGVTALAPVVQHVLEDTQPPLVILGEIGLEPIGGKDGGLDRCSIDIVTLFRGPKREGLFAIQAAVRTVLDNGTLTHANALFSSPTQLASEDELLEDGETYMGSQRFETIVQPS